MSAENTWRQLGENCWHLRNAVGKTIISVARTPATGRYEIMYWDVHGRPIDGTYDLNGLQRRLAEYIPTFGHDVAL